MKKLFMVIPLVFLLCFTFACQKGEEVAREVGVKALSDEDVAAIKNWLVDEKTLLSAGDWEGLSQLYTEDVVMMPPNAPIAQGREALLQMFAGSTVTDFSSTIEEIDGCGDIAYGRGTVSMTFQFEGAKGPISESAKWISIFRKQPDGKWLISVDIWNSNSPSSE